MSGLEPIRVLQQDALEELLRVLDTAVAHDPGLGPARAQLLRPIRALEAMSRDARGALGDDVFAAERLRLLLAATSNPTLTGLELLAESSPVIGAAHGSQPTALAPKLDLEELAAPGEPALLELGALVVVGLAAGRVGLSLGFAEPFVRIVFALALAVGPAEAVLRAVAHGMSPEQLRAVLGSFASEPDRTGSVASSLRTFLIDGSERDRWRCLKALFDLVREDVLERPWDAAGTGSIVSVTPEDACAGDRITLTLGLGGPETDDVAAQPTLDGSHFLPLLVAKKAHVLFASVGHETVGKRPASVDVEERTVVVVLPEDVRRGWLGLVDRDTRRSVNEARAAVSAAWEERNEKAPCLRDAPVPTDAIAELPRWPTPPRSAGGRLEAGLPVVARLTLEPREVSIGQPFDLLWRVEGADDQASIEPELGVVASAGRQRMLADGRTARLGFTLEATNACGTVEAIATGRVRARIELLSVGQSDTSAPPIRDRPLLVRISVLPKDAVGQAHVSAGAWKGSAPFDAGAAEIEIPAELARDGLVGRIVLVAEDGSRDDEREFGPIHFRDPSARTVVLVRPAHVSKSSKNVARVQAEDVQRALGDAARARGDDLDIVEPAWLDDQEVTFLARADGPDTPACRRLLELLNVVAARSPGLEDALWIALVPQRDGESGFHRLEPADGARGVAVATLDRMPALLAEPLPPVQPATERLRILGKIEPDGTVKVRGMRVEERRAGPGAPLASGARVVVRSGTAERVTHEIRVLSAARPVRFAALLPVDAEANAIEIGTHGAPHSLRVSRSRGRPALDTVAVSAEGELSWKYEHSASSRGAFTAEVSRNGGWSPVAVAGHCATSLALALERLSLVPASQRLRVVASDGWNAATGPDGGVPVAIPETRGAIARHAGGRTFWADLGPDRPEAAQVRWTFGNEAVTGYVVDLPDGFSGELRLSAPGLRDDVRVVSADGAVASRGLACEGCHDD